MQVDAVQRYVIALIAIAAHLAGGGMAGDFSSSALAARLQRLHCFGLQLRSSADAALNVVDYLLHRKPLGAPLLLSVNATQQRAACRHRGVVLPSDQLADTLETVHMARGGLLLLILVDEPDVPRLRQLALRLWLERGVYDVYYASPARGVFYNPFALRGNGDDGGGYGELIPFDGATAPDVAANLNGYALRTYIFNSVYSSVKVDAGRQRVSEVRGADAKAAQLLAERLNCTLQLQLPDDQFFGARLDNGSYNGALGRLLRYETDAVFSGFFVKDYLTRDIEFTVAVYMDELCCYVRKAERIPQSILPLFAVNVDVWSSFLAVGLFGPLIWLAMRCANLRLQPASAALVLALPLRWQCVRICIDTWVVWVRVNVLRFPPFMSERVFVLSLCLVSVIFGALFESSLATVYIHPMYYKDIGTMRELDEAQFRIYIKHAAMKDDLFYGHGSTVYRNLDGRVVLVAELEERLINMMSKRGGFAAVTRASSLLLDDIYYFITKKIHKIPECPKNYHIAFVLPKHSPYEERINALLLTFMQAGLIHHWVDEMKQRAKISIHRFPDYVAAEASDIWKVLTLRDLQLAFYALFMGSTLAVLAFAGEWCIARRSAAKWHTTKIRFTTKGRTGAIASTTIE